MNFVENVHSSTLVIIDWIKVDGPTSFSKLFVVTAVTAFFRSSCTIILFFKK